MLEQFGSVRGVMTADEAALANIDGIGRETARRIVWAIQDAPGEYSF
ncbi:MAG: helix-hairpin-helix domain-containing protein [Nitrococcus sp.]|nr:helix-hairpin-helix domain-containing protein [Nitrococcus sp.]